MYRQKRVVESNDLHERGQLLCPLTGKIAGSIKVLLRLQSVSASRANFHDPSLCRFNTRRSLRRILTGSSFADILNVAS